MQACLRQFLMSYYQHMFFQNAALFQFSAVRQAEVAGHKRCRATKSMSALVSQLELAATRCIFYSSA